VNEVGWLSVLLCYTLYLMLVGSGPVHAIRHAVQHRYTVFCSHAPVPIFILNHNLCMTPWHMVPIDEVIAGAWKQAPELFKLPWPYQLV
jgi:hypothetical protein